MEELFEKIHRVCALDPGGRGLASRAPAADGGRLAGALLAARRVLVATGFPVPAAHTGGAVGPTGETDGPGGAANIAGALLRLGKAVAVVTDTLSLPLVEAACAVAGPGVEVACAPMVAGPAFCRRLLESFRPDMVIAIERPGKHGGCYHNMRGERIDRWVADTDGLFREFGGITVAIGDGGNELGMGAYREIIRGHVAGGRDICADLGCDYPLAGGVSNWWGWGLQALLEAATGRELLPTAQEEEHLLRAVLAAGGVDGVLRRPALSVDGIPLAEHLEVLEQLRQLAGAYRAANKPVGVAETCK